MIAVDANAVVAMLVDDGELGSSVRTVYAAHDLAAPGLLGYELASVLRKLCQRELLADQVAVQALDDLRLVRLETVAFGPIHRRIWELRANLSVYDAAYVAVAETLDVPLLTFDGRLRAAPGVRCEFVEA